MGISSVVLRRLHRASHLSRARGAASLFSFGSVAWSDRVISDLYFSLAASQWSDYATGGTHLLPFLAGLDHCRHPSSVLDIGTGAGGTAAAMAERYPDASVVGVDISRRMLSQARDHYRFPNLEFRRADITRLPFPDSSFDLVTAYNVMPNPAELKRVIRPDGQFLCAWLHPREEPELVWLAHWRQIGYERTGVGEAGSGHWQLFDPVGPEDAVARRGNAAEG